MQQFMQSVYNLCNTWSPTVVLLAAVSLMFCGVCLIIPSQKVKESVKSAIPFIVVGVGIVLGAMTLAQEVSSAFVF